MTALPEPEGDEEIIRLMRAGNPRGIEALLRVHGPNVKGRLSVVFRRQPGDHALETATHDAALSLFRSADRLDPSGNLGGYFYVAAWNEMNRQEIEDRKRHVPLWEGAEEQIPAANTASAPSNDLTAKVRALINSLPKLERDVLLLDIAHNFRLPAKEAAAILGTTPAAIYSSRNRTKERLRELFGDDGDGQDGPKETP